MYSFVDTTEPQIGDTLPSEALNFNGQWIEEVVSGYRTLYVTGREMISSEVNDLEIGSADGSRYQSRRYNPRTITVGYQLIAGSNTEFRNQFIRLNALLSSEEGTLIFNDETDKFFTGTLVGGSDVPPGVNSITAELEFYCSNPFKYSVKEYEVVPTLDDSQTFALDYKGTYKTHPRFEVEMCSDNGFIGFVDDEGHILQFGNVDEADGEDYERNENLLTVYDFMNAKDDPQGEDYMHPHHGVTGSLKTSRWFNTDFLSLGSAGSLIGPLNGGLRTLNIPPDSNGYSGAKNFYSYFHVLFYAGIMGQTGEMSISWLTEDNQLIAGVSWYKTDCTGNTGHYEFWANGKMIKDHSYQTNHLQNQNPWYWDWGHCDLKKEGKVVTFFYYGGYYPYVIPEIENMECKKIQVAFKQYGSRSGSKYMTYVGINALYFRKVNVEKWKDVPNKFAIGDIFSVDCQSGEVTNNNLPTPSLGAIGNDWEELCLKPGTNQIRCLYSEWAQKPKFKMKYREAFL